MKNYYEILEVDKNASNEIIKVAYKSLVKKYHPDLNKSNGINASEDKIKEINDAYDTLSDPIKRSEYDQSLLNENISIEQYNLVVQENNRLKMELNNFKNNYTKYNNSSYNTNYYNNEDINYSNNTTNTFKYIFNNLDESIKNIIAIFLTLLIILIIFKIPFLRDFILGLFGNRFYIYNYCYSSIFCIFQKKIIKEVVIPLFINLFF